MEKQFAVKGAKSPKKIPRPAKAKYDARIDIALLSCPTYVYILGNIREDEGLDTPSDEDG